MTNLYSKTAVSQLRPSLWPNWMRQINSFVISPVNHKKVYLSLWKNFTKNVDELGNPVVNPWHYGVSRFFVGVDNSLDENKIKDKYETQEKLLTDIFPDVEDFKVITSVTASDRDENEVYISFSGYENEKQVIKSTDGGNSWIDISDGLPSLPVNKILFEEGSNNRLYAATDLGVYVKQGNNDWELFACGLPKTRVTDMRIDYCERRLKVSTFGRGFWDVSLPEIDESNDYEIHGNVLWNGDMKVFGKITVKQNANLTIKGRVEFAENAGILVEKGNGSLQSGGQLDIKGAYLTSLCTTWKGIRVESNNVIQNFSWSGSVIVHDNSTIANAEIGILNGGWDADILALSGDNFGGIIRVENSNFYNNNISIGFTRFLSPNNLSSVKSSHFYVDETIQGIWNPTNTIYSNDAFIYIDNSSLLNCENNVFENKQNTPFEVGHLSLTGIVAQNSDLTVNNNEFKNLHRAIRFHDTGESTELSMYLNDFLNCQGGAFLTGSGTALIYGNTFIGFDHHIPDPIDNFSEPYGLHLENFSRFHVHNNIFKNFSGDSYMVKVIDSGIRSNLVRSNSFEKGNVAVCSEGQNRNVNGSSGLVISCNTFKDNNQDILLLKGNTSTYGIKANQPSLNFAAGNRFETSNCTNESNIKSDAVQINYFYNSTAPFETPICATGSLINLVVTANSYDCYGVNNPLPVDPLPIDPEEPFGSNNENNLNNILNNFELKLWSDLEELNSLNSLIDGGNTQNLLFMTEELETNFEVMNSISPFLSDTVLSKIIDNSNQLEAFQLASILIQNSPLSDNIAQKYLLNPVLPGTYHNILVEYQTDYSAIFMLETNKILSTKEREFKENELVVSKKGFSNDTLNLIVTSIENIYDVSLYFEHLARLSRIKRAKEETILFSDSLPFTNLLHKSSLINQTNYDANQLSMLDSEAINEVVYWLRGKLFKHDKTILVEKPVTIGNKVNRSELLVWNKIKEQKFQNIKLFPNPSNKIINYVIIDDHELANNDYQYQLINSYGAIVESNIRRGSIGQINISDLPNGVYYFRLTNNEGINYSQTFIKN